MTDEVGPDFGFAAFIGGGALFEQVLFPDSIASNDN